MKYIVELHPDCVDGAFMKMPIRVAGEDQWIKTKVSLTPYTEPDRKAIDLRHARDIENVARINYNKGAKDAWEFARMVRRMNISDWIECFEQNILAGIFDLDYSEAKAKYDAWQKQKYEICVGDEVKFDIGNNDDMKAIALDQTGLNGEWSVLTENGCVEEHGEEELYKTGKHFDDVDHMLKKMMED